MRKHLIWLLIIMQITANAQFHVSGWGGMTHSWSSIKDFASSSASSHIAPFTSMTERHRIYYRNSFFAGIKGDIELASGLSLGVNLILESTGFQENLKQYYLSGSGAIFDSIAGKDVVRLIYMSAPVHLVFAAPIGNARLLVGAGAYISCGLTGNSDFYKLYSTYLPVTDSVEPVTFSNSSHFKSGFYHANRLDYGLSVMMGIQFRNRIFLEAILENGYRSVFKDRFVVEDAYGQMIFSSPNKRRVVMMGLGYRFK